MKIRFNALLVSVYMIASGQHMPALADPIDPSDYETLEAQLIHHPSLIALTYQADASRERGIAATALPDPVVSVGVNNFPIFDPSFSEFLPTNKAVGVRQRFPNRAGRNARAGQNQATADQIDRIRAAQLATLRGTLISLLHEKRRIDRQRDLAQKRNAKYDELTEVVEELSAETVLPGGSESI